jgi:hypothetical protein
MSDFERDVRAHLSDLRLKEIEREAVISEIATHLELAAQEIDNEGVAGIDRERQVLAQIGDWNQLKKGIRRYKETVMRDRFRRLWMPALTTGVVAYTAQLLTAQFVSWPRSFAINGIYYSYFWQWYVILVVTGALGAFWSRQAGGSRRERIAVALAPSAVMAVVVLSVMPIDILISAVVNHEAAYVNVIRDPILFLSGLTSWVIVPAIPSLLGAIAFLDQPKTPTRTSATV